MRSFRRRSANSFYWKGKESSSSERKTSGVSYLPSAKPHITSEIISWLLAAPQSSECSQLSKKTKLIVFSEPFPLSTFFVGISHSSATQNLKKLIILLCRFIITHFSLIYPLFCSSFSKSYRKTTGLFDFTLLSIEIEWTPPKWYQIDLNIGMITLRTYAYWFNNGANEKIESLA